MSCECVCVSGIPKDLAVKAPRHCSHIRVLMHMVYAVYGVYGVYGVELEKNQLECRWHWVKSQKISS